MTGRNDKGDELAVPDLTPDTQIDQQPPTSPGSLLPTPEELWPRLPPREYLNTDIVEQERPPYIAGTIDVAAFLKAQSAFVRAQSYFLRSGRLNGGEEYVLNLTNYSKAQDDYIQAMHQILETLGVI